jgi:hypothetical protein
MERVKKLLIGLLLVGVALPVLPRVSEAQMPQLTPVIFPLTGTAFTCSQTKRISNSLGNAQPLKVTGHCIEATALSISDTRTNITILGRGTGACGDPNNTTLTVVEKINGDTPNSASTIIDVRGKNILVTGLEIFGVSSNPNIDNRRGIRISRGGTMQVGRNVTLSQGANQSDTIYQEQSGVCIRDLGKAGIEVNQGGFLRVTNTEIMNVGGDAISVTEHAAATIGFTSGGEFGLVTDAFPGPGHAGPNWLHGNLGNGVNVSRNSEARIVGNTIASNLKDGINVNRNSHVDIADNLINGNTGWAIQLTDNSNANLGTTSGPVNPALGFCNNALPGQGCGVPFGTVSLTNNANPVTIPNTAGNVKCTWSDIRGRWTFGRDGAVSPALGPLSDNGTGAPVAGSFTTCNSSLN